MDNIMTCGDTGNDEDMLIGDSCSVVVGNYSPELEPLKNRKKIYFAGKPFSEGILEGIRNYNFLEQI